MNKAPNKSNNEPNNENAKVLSDKELEGINGGLESVKLKDVNTAIAYKVLANFGME